MSNPFETPHTRCSRCGNGFCPESMPDWARNGCGCPNPECPLARHSDSPFVDCWEPPEPLPLMRPMPTELESIRINVRRYHREMWTRGKMRDDMPRWWTWVEASR